MLCPLAESHALVNALIDVRYKSGDADALRARCEAWCKVDHESGVRDAFTGSRMLAPQLDLIDKARDRVEAVRFNCIQIQRARA